MTATSVPTLCAPPVIPLRRNRRAGLAPASVANPFVARCLGGRPRARPAASTIAAPVAGVAVLALLLRFALTGSPIDGLFAVVLSGVAAWRVAAPLQRPACVGRKPANDNPPRPRLPPLRPW